MDKEKVALALQRSESEIGPPFLEMKMAPHLVPQFAWEVSRLRRFIPIVVLVNGSLCTGLEVNEQCVRITGQPIKWE